MKGVNFSQEGEGLKFKIVINCCWEERVKLPLIINGVKFIINILFGIKGVNFSLKGEGLKLKSLSTVLGRKRLSYH